MNKHSRASLLRQGWAGFSALFAVVLLLSSCGSTRQIKVSEPRSQPEAEYLSFDENPADRLRTDVVTAAEAHIGKPYSYGSKGPSSFDCSGFTSYVLGHFDIALLGSSTAQSQQGRAVEPQRCQPGDLLYFKTPEGRVHHVAVVVCNSEKGIEVVHATTSRGVIRENVSNSTYWLPRLAGARDVADCRPGMVASN